MGKLCILVTISLLFTAGYLIIHGNVSVSRGDETFAPMFSYWSRDLDVSDISLASYIGEASLDNSGRSVSGAGDVNGDGYDDILIGAQSNGEVLYRAGQTYLIFGNASGWSTAVGLGSNNASFIGEATYDYSGTSVSGAGDVNGDGYDDILIGAGVNDEGGADAGQTYLIFGKSTGWSMDTSLSNADASFIGEAAGDGSGRSASGAGDVNGDGYDDILIGAWYNEEGGQNAGQTYLILGRSTGWSMDMDLSKANASFIGENANDESGYSVSGAGDVNGDGYDDILIGACFDSDNGIWAGQTYLILGKETDWSMDMDLSSANASFIGEGSDEYVGCSVSGAGDVNGDGYDDILIGAYMSDGGGVDSGQTYLILGRSTGWSMDMDLSSANASFIGEAAEDHSGTSVSGAGDVNGDGYDDILIGARSNDEGVADSGQTYVFLGSSTGWKMDTSLSTADASFIGEAVDDQLGTSVSGAGDVNGDGYDDILIGAQYNDIGGQDAGKTYLISGGNGSIRFENDLTSVTATTGDDLTFSINMKGEIPISSMFIEYWFGAERHVNVSMTDVGGLTWNRTIGIPNNSLDDLHYKFSAQVRTKIWINTSVKDVTILDNDVPEFKDEFTYSSAFTGDPFVFSIMTIDNIGVNKVDVDYWFGSGEHEYITLSAEPDSLWEAEIMIPMNSLESLNYKYIAHDDSGNYNDTSIGNIPVYDNDKPGLNATQQVSSVIGGTDLSLSVEVTDNINVSDVFIEYWASKDPTIENISLDKGTGDKWDVVFTVPDLFDTLNYRFLAVDTSDNWGQTETFDVDVEELDITPPVFGEDTSDTYATTGGSYTFRVMISDNVGLASSYVKYWCNDEVPKKSALSGFEQFTSTITVPMNWTELSYLFYAEDAEENYNETEPRTINVLDDDLPMILEHQEEDTCGTGSVLTLSVKVSDNIAISSVIVQYWYGDNAPQDLYLEYYDASYVGSIEIPVDSLATLYYTINVFDTTGNEGESSNFMVRVIDIIAPSIEDIDDIRMYVGDEIDITLNAEDNIVIDYYYWTGSPVDVSRDRMAGILTDSGEYVIQVVVKDRGGNSNSTSFKLTVLPLDHDEDGDGIPDLVEMEFGLDPIDSTDAALDLDGDGLSNLREYELGTNMSDDDTDGDGHSDGYEVENGFDPLDPQSEKDMEGPKKRDSSDWIWIVIIITAIIFISVTIGAFLYMRRKKDKSEDALSGGPPTDTAQAESDTPQSFSPPDANTEPDASSSAAFQQP